MMERPDLAGHAGMQVPGPLGAAVWHPIWNWNWNWKCRARATVTATRLVWSRKRCTTSSDTPTFFDILSYCNRSKGFSTGSCKRHVPLIILVNVTARHSCRLPCLTPLASGLTYAPRDQSCGVNAVIFCLPFCYSH